MNNKTKEIILQCRDLGTTTYRKMCTFEDKELAELVCLLLIEFDKEVKKRNSIAVRSYIREWRITELIK